MKRTTFALVLALVAVLAIGVVSATAGKTKKINTAITVKYSSGSGNPYFEGAKFHGKVSARKKFCVKKRKVVVKEKDGTKIGSDLTNKNGKYVVPAEGSGPGKYVAKAKKKVRKRHGKKLVCRPAKATITVK